MLRTRIARLLVFVALLTALSSASFAGVFISINVAPPPLPVYEQPPCPGPDFLWTPGFWAWGDEGYYWVPGTWVPAPEPGLLWTPGYWGWSDGAYLWHAGYWGPHVGFYGGVNYGFGYGGVGFFGGEWRHGSFFYNSAVLNVGGPRITNVYVNRTVIVNEHGGPRYSFNGPGGIRRAPGREEMIASHDRHMEATQHQMQHQDTAAHNPGNFARNNAGRPAVAATSRPGEFSGHDAVPARSAGGRVAPSTMNATPRSMPESRNTPSPSTRGNTPSNMNRGGNANPSRPAAGNNTYPSQPARNAAGNTPQRGGGATTNTARPQQMQQQRPAQQTPQQRQTPQAQQQHSAPQQQHGAPQAQPKGGNQNHGEKHDEPHH
ncbi:MAG: YXWGXW repeat-containing protein [Acidobacteriota bacterium]|nr:YXWGXW repeat-containing protein [Acidobacteriota bacterium]